MLKRTANPIVKSVSFNKDVLGAGRIIQIFQNADLRLSVPGLSQICKKYDLNVDEIGPGEYVVFINTKQTMIKVLTNSRVLAQMRRNNDERIDLNTIRYIPLSFMAKGKLSYDDMLRDYFESKN